MKKKCVSYLGVDFHYQSREKLKFFGLQSCKPGIERFLIGLINLSLNKSLDQIIQIVKELSWFSASDF